MYPCRLMILFANFFDHQVFSPYFAIKLSSSTTFNESICRYFLFVLSENEVNFEKFRVHITELVFSLIPNTE